MIGVTEWWSDGVIEWWSGGVVEWFEWWSVASEGDAECPGAGKAKLRLSRRFSLGFR